MATRELQKKRGASNPSVPRRAGLKGKEEKVVVQSAPEKSKADNTQTEGPASTKPEDVLQQSTNLDNSQEENTKDTGQEKDTSSHFPNEKKKKYEGKEQGVMESPRYLKSPREKSRERSSSPFRRNVVEPLPPGASTATENQGSLVSLHSQGSAASREAWPERKDSVSTLKSRTALCPQPQPDLSCCSSSTGSPQVDVDLSWGNPSEKTLRSQFDSAVSGDDSRPLAGKQLKKKAQTKETPVDTISIKTEAQQNAYIPYTYARSCIARISGDMSEMKTKHLHIVQDIEKHYRAIEDETQVQFNGFVLMLRQQYKGKLDTFRQVIELYRTQMSRKEEFWKDSMESMTQRVNKLLKDRKVLLVNNRQEVDKLEKEKAVIMAQYTSQMDQEKSAATVVGKDLEKKVEDLKEEKKRLKEELEEEREAVARLKAAASSAATTAVAVSAVSGAAAKEEKEEKTSEEQSAPAKEGKRMEEQQRAAEERHQMREDMDRMGDERQDLMDKIKGLQADATRLSLESGEWQEKYRLMSLQAGESEKLRQQYAQLESQYKALALVIAASPEAAQAAEDGSSQVEKDHAAMEEERQRLQKEIEKWEKEFKKKHKREPTEDDKPDSAKEMYTSLGEVEQMVESLDQQKETLKAVKSGTIPPTPDLPPSGADVAEPQVSVVEVKVPDPDIVTSLEKSQATVDNLQTRLAALQDENANLRSQLADLEAGVTAPPVVAAAVVQGDDSEKVEKLTAELEDRDSELEKLRAEKREMAKDMKKMMRQHMKLQAKMAETDPDTARLLQMVAVLVQSIHGEHEEASRAVEKRLDAAKEAAKPLSDKEAGAKKTLSAWDKKYKKTHGNVPEEKDRDEEGQALAEAAADASKALDIKQLEIRALTLLTTGIYSPQEQKRPTSASRATPETDMDQQLSVLDNKVIDLEGERDKLLEDNNKLQASVQSLEEELTDLKEQLAAQASMAAVAVTAGSSEDTTELQKEVDSLNAALQQERAAHDATREELESLQKQLQMLKEEITALQSQSATNIHKATTVLETSLATKEEQLAEAKMRNEELEKERLANVPMDTAKEIKNLQNKVAMLEKDKADMKTSAATQGAAMLEVKSQLDVANKALGTQRAANRDLEAKVKSARAEKEKAVKELTNQIDKKEQQRAALETKLKQLQAATAATVSATAATKAGATKGAKGKPESEDTAALKREIRELNARIKQLEAEARRSGNVAVAAAVEGAAPDRNVQKRHEKILKELEKKLEIEMNKTAKLTEAQKLKDEEVKTLTKDVKDKDAEITKLKAELATLGVAAKEGVAAAGKVKSLEAENKKLTEENKVLTENYNSERVLRKKYYNMVEDMKGKIRVYARARPLSTAETERGNTSVVKSPDEFSIQVTSQRGLKEFQFDQIFMEDSTQEKVFEDTNNLIQSAVDGYNVCIFAYGQTGSGKTFTMIGDRGQRFPGIAPRAFERIFELGQENKSKFDMSVTAYMLELYNDKLIDLFAKPNTYDEDKLDIKKDKKGMVFVQGAVVKGASNAKELYALFEEGSKNRHVASTKMNAESSRSHLVIGVVMESTNKSSGNVVKGKLSLVDLAGSERVGKTGASAEQLKEAMSINKSLSALGDVISALSSEQQFIPYRNNKLTMLMQDSLGGNAKTLMFVNVSPADYNCDETVISLTYASRVKLITNDASKNADNKEVARLKAVISKLKAGERVDDEDI